MNPEKIFTLMFSSRKISDLRLIRYAEVALYRLKSDNPGNVFTPLVEPLETALTTFKATVIETSILKSQKEGATVEVDDIIKEFRKVTLQREGLIRDTFRVESEEYQIFYPQGTSEYTRMTKTNAGQLMQRMVSAYIQHEASLPEGRRTEMENLFNDYTTARSSQLEITGRLAGKLSDKRNGRTLLETRLQLNLLTIACEFPGKPEMYHRYFEHHLLYGNR